MPALAVSPISCGLLFMEAVKVKADHIPYRGGGPALNDVMAGHVDLNCASLVAGEINSWHALYTRAGTPAAILARLKAALKAALADGKVMSTFERTGVMLYPVAQQTSEAAMEMLNSEIKRWGEVIRANNIAPPG